MARHSLLRKIANASEGAFYKNNNWEALQNDLMQNPAARSYQVLETTTGSIVEKRWLFAVFLLLMALEWGLRKYFGRY
ncbi:MAG: hypothetical protein U5L96_21710 [Owenweeksia sp.]|nr:hypothetical protein [Owenweeksia sp.]